MKVIFLDVDGVLNTEECLDVPEQSSEYVYDASTAVPLLTRCVDNLQEICEATSAKVETILRNSILSFKAFAFAFSS